MTIPPQREPDTEREPWCPPGPYTDRELAVFAALDAVRDRMEWFNAVELGPQCSRDRHIFEDALHRVQNLVRRNAHRRRIAQAERTDPL